MVEKTKITALVVANRGALRNSLVACLLATQKIDVAAVLDDPEAALKLARDIRPDALVSDSGLTEEGILSLVRQMRSEQPALRSIVLLNRITQRELFLTAGASQVMFRGMLDGLSDAVIGPAWYG